MQFRPVGCGRHEAPYMKTLQQMAGKGDAHGRPFGPWQRVLWMEMYSLFMVSVLIYDIFNDAVNITNYVVPKEGMMNECWIGKFMEGSDSTLIQGIYPGIFPGRDRGKAGEMQSR
jgi:hypothetical protein